MIIDGKAHNVYIWDVAGNELESGLMKVYLRDALGVFLVCDI